MLSMIKSPFPVFFFTGWQSFMPLFMLFLQQVGASSTLPFEAEEVSTKNPVAIMRAVRAKYVQ